MRQLREFRPDVDDWFDYLRWLEWSLLPHPPAPPRRVRDLDVQHRSRHMSTATLTWTVPTTRVDGSALAPADIASIDVFDTDPTTPIGNVPGAGTSFTTGTLAVGNHAFTVVVNDTAGHKSAPSNSVAVTIAPTLAAPSAVADLAATVNP